MKDRINEMYAFTCIDPDGNEGVIGMLGTNNMWLPLVGANMERVAALKKVAQDVANNRHIVVTLKHFSTMTIAETFFPDREEGN